MEFVEELNSHNSAKSLMENSTKNIKEGIIPPTGKSECAFVPNPLYLTPSASVDLGNTLRGQLKFSLRSADKGRGGERGKVEDGAERGLLISKLLSLFVPYKKEGDYADFDL